jgi:L-ribulose-5-phosphate 3-epimerase
MNPVTTRRNFLKTAGTALSLASVSPRLFAADDKAAAAGRKRSNLKAIMWGTIGVKGSVMEKMKAVNAAGFDAVEMVSHLDQAEVLKARDETGLAVVSVCGEKHWGKPLSHPDPKVREEGFAGLQQTLRDAKVYGADSILLVPGVVNKDVNFEDCWQRSIEQIRRAIPLSQELGVKISIENVWNNFITTEDKAVKYLDEINSPWVAWHFDTGNIIRYGEPIDWIKALGKRITRVHIKEYSRDRAMRAGDVWKGFAAPLLEGANNWPGIMKALDDIGFTGPLITEQGGGDTAEGLKDLVGRLEKIRTIN